MPEVHPFANALKKHFRGRIAYGGHKPDGVGCTLEIVAYARGIQWTDSPSKIGFPDLRPLNDYIESDKSRTQIMTPVALALWNWPLWSSEEKAAWNRRVALSVAAWRAKRQIIRENRYGKPRLGYNIRSAYAAFTDARWLVGTASQLDFAKAFAGFCVEEAVKIEAERASRDAT